MYLEKTGDYTWYVKQEETVVYKFLTRERVYYPDKYLINLPVRSKTPFAFQPPAILMSNVREDWKYSFTTSLKDGLEWIRGVGVPEEDIHYLLLDLEEKGWELDKELLQEYNTE